MNKRTDIPGRRGVMLPRTPGFSFLVILLLLLSMAIPWTVWAGRNQPGGIVVERVQGEMEGERALFHVRFA